MDSRIIDLADMLAHSALSIQKNENVLIETTDTPDALSSLWFGRLPARGRGHF